MASAFMNPLDSLGRWCLRDAPHHPGVRISPRALEIDVFIGLDVHVSLMGLLQDSGGESADALVGVLRILLALVAGLLFGNLLIPARRNL